MSLNSYSSMQPLPRELRGQPYCKVRRSFDGIVICGYIRDGHIEMLPDEGEVMREGEPRGMGG